MAATLVVDLPAPIAFQAYAYSPFSKRFTFSSSVASWGACTAKVYPAAGDRTVLASMTVDDPDNTTRVVLLTENQMTGLLGSETVRRVLWWEFERADGEVVFAGSFTVTTVVD